jgi:hypothetical protein
MSCVLATDMPEFSGPWKDDFSKAYAHTSVSIVREILCDGVITEAEAAEINDRFRECLEAAGLTEVRISEYGQLGISIPPGSDAATVNAQERACEDDTGWFPVNMLYNNVRTNPDNVDKDQLTADCLVRLGLRPEGYSLADLNNEYSGDNAFSDIADNPKLWECQNDPLHAQ